PRGHQPGHAPVAPVRLPLGLRRAHGPVDPAPVADRVSALAGNHCDKYAQRNPLARALVSRWRAQLRALVTAAAPGSLLDVGCGEGVLTAEWAAALPRARVVGVDVEDVVEVAPAANLSFQTVAPAPPLQFPDASFDLVAAVESLEHMADPEG